ncbi:NADH pyrophosphatase [Geranomyces variabilis]|uniref:NAD(+) diphosphatase n=1 Tax=Geranomyces variabilis TaxID=109894 RepID=A0AAD5TJH2_9FUNG|nr:NADH pyrophosphatase [Geranomyces variabilis]
MSATRFTHLFAGSSLNRLSVLRGNSAYIAHALRSPRTRFIALRQLEPLLTDGHVAWLSADTVQQALAAGAPHVFLGVDEADEAADGEDGAVFSWTRKGGAVATVKGRSYWAIDLSPGACDDAVLKQLDDVFQSSDYKFVGLRGAMASLSWGEEAAYIAHARSIIDWNVRNQFCPACGQQTDSTDAGYKRACPRPAEGTVTDPKTKKCLSLSPGVNNFQYPRTDPVVIIAVTHPTDPNKILLGRQARFPAGTYTCVAGFMEAGETIEEAARREVFEETGVKVGAVAYHSSQPWPFPNSVMIGCVGKAVTTDIDLVDEELEDAKWFTREQAAAAVAAHERAAASASAGAGANGFAVWPEGGGIRVPPPYAIAHQLIKAWLGGFGPRELEAKI